MKDKNDSNSNKQRKLQQNTAGLMTQYNWFLLDKLNDGTRSFNLLVNYCVTFVQIGSCKII